MFCFIQQRIKQNDQRRCKEKYRDQADTNAFGQCHTQIRADPKPHKDQSQKADHSGQPTGQDRSGGFAQCIDHGVFSIFVCLTAFGKALDQKYGIVQRYGQLQDIARSVGDEGNLAKDQIASGIDDDGHTQTEQYKDRFCKGGCGQDQYQKDKNNGDHRNFLDLRYGIVRGSSCGGGTSRDGVVVTDDIPDRRNGADAAFLRNRDGEKRSIVNVVAFQYVTIDCSKRLCNIYAVVQPCDVCHALHLTDFVFIFQRFRNRYIFYHDAGVGNTTVKFFVHHIEGFGGSGIFRQVIVHVVVYSDQWLAQGTEYSDQKKQAKDPFPQHNNMGIKFFHAADLLSIVLAAVRSCLQQPYGESVGDYI